MFFFCIGSDSLRWVNSVNNCTVLPPLLLDGLGTSQLIHSWAARNFTSIIIQLIKFSTQNMEFGLENEKSDAKYCCQVCGDLATCYRCDVQQNKTIIFISSPLLSLQAVRSQVSLLLLQDILQASCEGRPDLPL